MKQRFFKLNSHWYADVPGHTLDENEMACGADSLLEEISIAIVSLGLMSAEDYAIQEQVAYTSFKEPENYDPEVFAYDANRGELRKEYSWQAYV